LKRRSVSILGSILASSFAALALLGACGGKVDGDDEAPQSPPAMSGSSGAASGFSDDTPLAECELGFEPGSAPERDCHWLAADRCYATKLAACACICPRGAQHSVCASEFDNGPNGRARVNCS
jgi:hypothetical protein